MTKVNGPTFIPVSDSASEVTSRRVIAAGAQMLRSRVPNTAGDSFHRYYILRNCLANKAHIRCWTNIKWSP